MTLEKIVIKKENLKSIDEVSEGNFILDGENEKYIRQVEEEINAFMTYYGDNNGTQVDIYAFEEEKLKIIGGSWIPQDYNQLIDGMNTSKKYFNNK